MEEDLEDYGEDAKGVLRQPTRKLLLELLKARSDRPLVLSQLSSQAKKHHSSVWTNRFLILLQEYQFLLKILLVHLGFLLFPNYLS